MDEVISMVDIENTSNSNRMVTEPSIDIIDVVGKRDISRHLCRRLCNGDVVSISRTGRSGKYKVKLTYDTGICSDTVEFDNIMDKVKKLGINCKCSGWIYDNPKRCMVSSMNTGEMVMIDPTDIDELCCYCNP